MVPDVQTQFVSHSLNVLDYMLQLDLLVVPEFVPLPVQLAVGKPREFVAVDVAESLAIVRGSKARVLTQHWQHLSPLRKGDLL